ncbi:MAG: hypothetical protein RSC76_06265 [Oscillospiraceae bacterium]
MNYGVQLFGCSQEFRRNTSGFFAKMKEIGIGEIEPCLMFDDPIAFREAAEKRGDRFAASFPSLLWLPPEVPRLCGELRDAGLTLRSAHAFVADPLGAKDVMIATAAENGIQAYVLNVPPRAFEDPKAFSRELSTLAQALAEKKVELWLHCSGKDVAQKVEGDSLYRWLLKDCGNLGAQPDLGWILLGGEEPYAYTKSLGTALRSLHFKDIAPDYEKKTETDVFAVLGDGCLDTKKLLTLAADESISVIIDQDFSRGDFIEDLARSVRALNQA